MDAVVDLDREALDRLVARAQRDIDDGVLPAAQLALARDGEVVFEAAFGPVTTETRFVAFSCTKAIVAATVWRLIADGSLDVARTVGSYIPEFAPNGKADVTVEQVLLHTSGFPYAPLGAPEWATRSGRLDRFGRWRLTSEPGARYEYHPTSAHWVLAELIERLTSMPYPDAIHALVTEPLGLPRLLAIPLDEQDGIAPLSQVGELPTSEELKAALGFEVDLAKLLGPGLSFDWLLSLDDPDAKAVGVPGGGGVMRAADLARFYQALLHDPQGLWPADLLADVTGCIRNDLPDWMGVPAHRTWGLMVAGDDGKAAVRGFGRTASPRAFGHNGAGGQIAWADPATGLSFVYFTNALDQQLIRERRRVTAIASLAASTLPPP